LTLWKNTGATADGYVTGLEPGTNYPNNRRIERQAGRLATLAPGQRREFVLDVGVHTSRREVEALLDEIAALQGPRQTQIDPKPQAHG
jgi:hypothetical protein